MLFQEFSLTMHTNEVKHQKNYDLLCNFLAPAMNDELLDEKNFQLTDY